MSWKWLDENSWVNQKNLFERTPPRAFMADDRRWNERSFDTRPRRMLLRRYRWEAIMIGVAPWNKFSSGGRRIDSHLAGSKGLAPRDTEAEELTALKEELPMAWELAEGDWEMVCPLRTFGSRDVDGLKGSINSFWTSFLSESNTKKNKSSPYSAWIVLWLCGSTFNNQEFFGN